MFIFLGIFKFSKTTFGIIGFAEIRLTKLTNNAPYRINPNNTRSKKLSQKVNLYFQYIFRVYLIMNNFAF